MKLTVEILGHSLTLSLDAGRPQVPAPSHEENERKWTAWQKNTKNSNANVSFGFGLPDIVRPSRRWNP